MRSGPASLTPARLWHPAQVVAKRPAAQSVLVEPVLVGGIVEWVSTALALTETAGRFVAGWAVRLKLKASRIIRLAEKMTPPGTRPGKHICQLLKLDIKCNLSCTMFSVAELELAAQHKYFFDACQSIPPKG